MQKRTKRENGRTNKASASCARIQLTNRVHRDLLVVIPTLRPGDHGALAINNMDHKKAIENKRKIAFRSRRIAMLAKEIIPNCE